MGYVSLQEGIICRWWFQTSGQNTKLQGFIGTPHVSIVCLRQFETTTYRFFQVQAHLAPK